MNFNDDLNVFFGTDEFTVIVTLENGATVNAIFDNAYFENEFGVTLTKPILTLTNDDAISLKKESIIFTNGIKYSVKEIQNDNSGIVVVLLEKVS